MKPVSHRATNARRFLWASATWVLLTLLIAFPGKSQALEFAPYHAKGIDFNGGVFADTVFENMPYIRSELMDSLLGGYSRWVPSAQQLHFQDKKDRQWILTLDNPFVVIQGEVFNLTYPVRRDAEGLYLPLYPLLRLLHAKFAIDLPLPSPSPPPTFASDGSESNAALADSDADDEGTDSPAAAAKNDLPKKPLSATSAKSGRGTIIVDPGHGGRDRGATFKGVEEAKITLAVAKELKKDLVKLGYDVKLTREDDEYKTLAERPKFASDQGGDVFVSLHCNSLANPTGGKQSENPGITGSTVYILREGQSDEDKALARRENDAVEEESGKATKAEISPVDWILLEHQLNLYSKQSESLAESIVRGFNGFEIPKYSTGARQAGFFVLVGAYMPAVLFEMGFLTHPKDRAILNSKSGQREIAQRLAVAIDRFRTQIKPSSR
jgi:N-acetylmuramoyl-L-alanine amidase